MVEEQQYHRKAAHLEKHASSYQKLAGSPELLGPKNGTAAVHFFMKGHVAHSSHLKGVPVCGVSNTILSTWRACSIHSFPSVLAAVCAVTNTMTKRNAGKGGGVVLA